MSVALNELEINEIHTYLNNLRSVIDEKLREKLPRDVEIIDIHAILDDSLEYTAKEQITVEIDVTKILGLEEECLWFEGIENHCAEAIAANHNCDEDNIEKCQKHFRDCVEEHVKEFRKETCVPPFIFEYMNLPLSRAKLDVLEDEDAYRICCGVKLVYTYTQYPFKSALPELVKSKESMEYTANLIATEILRLIEALRMIAR